MQKGLSLMLSRVSVISPLMIMRSVSWWPELNTPRRSRLCMIVEYRVSSPRAPSGWSDSIDHRPFYMIDCSKGSTTMLYGCKNAQLSSCNQTWFYKYHPNINSAKLSDHPMAKERERKIGCSLDTQSIELNRKNVQNVTIYIYIYACIYRPELQ